MTSHLPSVGLLASASRTQWLALACVLFLAAALRAFDIGGQSFWIDEFFALEHSAGRGVEHAEYAVDVLAPLPDDFTAMSGFRPAAIWRGMGDDSHPPLYFVALGAWRSAFGDGEAASRSLSAVMSLIAVGTLIGAVREQAGWRPAIWAGAVAGTSGIAVQFAQEARNYAMLSAILYGGAWLVIRIERQGRTGWPCAIATGLVFLSAPLTHYLAVVPFTALATYGIVRLRGQARWRFVAAIVAAASVFIFAWVPTLVEQYHNGLMAKMRWMGRVPEQRIGDVLLRLLAWPWDALVYDVRSAAWPRYVVGVAALAMLCAGRRERATHLWLLLAAATLTHVAVMDVSERTDRISVARYTMAVGPAFWAAVCVAADRTAWSRHFVPMLAVALCLFRADAPYRERKADWRPLASWLESRARTGDVVLFTGPPEELWRTQNYMLAMRHYTRRPDCDAGPRWAVLSREPSAALRAAIRDARRAFVIHATIGVPPAGWFGDDARLFIGPIVYPMATGASVERAPSIRPTNSTAPSPELP